VVSGRSALANVGLEANWSGRSVLVTGAAGLLGGSVSQHLQASGAVVVGMDIAWDRPGAKLHLNGVRRIDGDVRTSALLRQALGDLAIDTVIHLAAQTLVGPALDDPVGTFSHNIEGSWAVLEACRQAPRVTAIVVASSDKAYGDWYGSPYREDLALRARHPYDVSKAAADLLAQSYAATYGLSVAITRCGNLYGGGDLNWSRIVPGTIRAILEGDRPVIRSDGSPVRDYLHVDDAGIGVMMLAEAMRKRPDLKGEAFNLASGDRLAVIEIVRRILALMGSALEPIVEGRALQEIPEQRLVTTKAKRVLGWRPRTTLDAGLREAIEWYRKNLSAVV
jgi:CDP-glucose 4,6-dehydratase